MTRKEKVQRAIRDIQQNHNWSWAHEIDERNKNHLDESIMFYRGKKITYREFKEVSDQMAKSLLASGFTKGSEIPICMANCPEFVMLLRAASLIGAKVNVFGAEFDEDYIAQIIKKTKAPRVFITDDVYPHLKGALDKSQIENITAFSLADSLPMGIDPYIEYDAEYYDFKNRVPKYKEEDARIQNKSDFLHLGNSIEEEVTYADVGLDDEFLITYTSGSTNATVPKGIVHNNSSLIYMGRFHDPDLSGLPATRGIRNLAHIPTHSNTDIITSISDSLMQNCEVALEPIYHQDFFIYSLMINQPHFAPATRSMYIRMCKRYNTEPQFKGVTFKNLYIPTIVGEPHSPGEEKYINATLRKAKAGINKLKGIISPTISVGGGDCEHGGLFFTLYKTYLEKLNKVRLRKGHLGLIPFNPSIEVVCLDKNGNYLGPNQYGVLAANSLCTMKEYKDNPDATKEFFVYDNCGNKYANLNVYGYIDSHGTVHMKGRVGNAISLSNGEEFPLFQINDLIAKDTKRILSSEVVFVNGAVVCNVEAMPGIKISEEALISSILQRLAKELPFEVMQKLLFKVRSFEEGYPTTGCEKRNNNALIQEGLTEDMIKGEVYEHVVILTYPFNDYKGLKRVRF